MCFKEKPLEQSGGERQDDRSPLAAYMGELEPPIFVVPTPVIVALVLESLWTSLATEVAILVLYLSSIVGSQLYTRMVLEMCVGLLDVMLLRH